MSLGFAAWRRADHPCGLPNDGTCPTISFTPIWRFRGYGVAGGAGRNADQSHVAGESGTAPKPERISRTGVEIYPTSEWELFIYKLKADKWCIGEPLPNLFMPEGTRIAAVFRDNQLLHPSGSTELCEGDTWSVMAQERDPESLSR